MIKLFYYDLPPKIHGVAIAISDTQAEAAKKRQLSTLKQNADSTEVQNSAQRKSKVRDELAKIAGTYLVAIDPKQCVLRQRFVFGHELAHIFLHHHDSKNNVMIDEAEANRKAWNYYRMYRDAFMQLQATGKAVL